MIRHGITSSSGRAPRHTMFRGARRSVVLALGVAGLTTATLGSVAAAAATPRPHTTSGVHFSVQASCGVAKKGFARCFALRVAGSQHLSSQAGPAGYHPADLVKAYGLSASAGSGMTVAIVDSYNDPNAESDLAFYRSTFGLPACTTANGCFKKVAQNGSTNYPKNNAGWSQEISLDLDMVSAICPSCHILLVEANSNSNADLAASVNEAVTLGANAVSNSYGGSEDTNASDMAAYNHHGVAITASSGDSGYAGGPQSPADYPALTAVGGTTLRRSTTVSRGWTEKVWNGTGSGCSAKIAKPSWQKDTGCAKRTIADVAAVADPNTGVAVYDTFGGVGGWQVFGGTSVASPIIAAVYALAGNTASINDASFLYAHHTSLHDVTKGTNGSCGGSYLCTAKKGYDGPTGWGTPNGTAAF